MAGLSGAGGAQEARGRWPARGLVVLILTLVLLPSPGPGAIWKPCCKMAIP